MKIRKAVIPIAGLGTRFLPLSKIIPKEFFPLGTKPVVQYVVEEALKAGVREIIFVISPKKEDIFKNYILKYFKQEKNLLKILRRRRKKKAIKALGEIPKIKYKYIFQKKPLGDGDAILRTERLVGKEPFLVLFGDDISWGEEGMPSQLVKTFEKIKKPLLCLYKMPREKLSSYGVPKVQKIKGRLYKIKDLIEKPKENPPSNFALVGNYVLTPDIFSYLKKTTPQNEEIILANALKQMIKEGKEIFGLWVKGKWLECGDKEKWIKSFIFLTKSSKK
ncbi:MAG: UTP--glucose-1-phosphate uridylyltransferase [Candidatus Nealsonbacteria bacterium]|nr:MAG: UTP--glucose-1-phosphate uridylyltransferase [Candidatus Nealsonbacteria bacterium]